MTHNRHRQHEWLLTVFLRGDTEVEDLAEWVGSGWAEREGGGEKRKGMKK